MKLKYREIQEKTRDIQIFGSLINKWIFQRNELNEKRNIYFNKIYGENAGNNDIDEIYPNYEIDINNTKKNYHKTFEEQLELIKNIDIPNEEEEINTNKKQIYNNSDNIKQIFNQVEENKKDNIINTNNENNEIKNENNVNDNNQENNNENLNKKNEDEKDNKQIDLNDIKIDIDNNKDNINIEKEDEKENKQIDLNDIQLDIQNNNENNDNNKDKKDNINEEVINNKEEEINKKEKEEKPYKYDNKNKYLQNINLFPEKEIPEDIETLYKLTTLINDEDENDNIINNDIFLNKKNKDKQIPIQLIIKEFFHDIIIKQNAITNQTFVLMLKNKFGLMHHFDFFNSIILCNKGNLILQYIESIFDFKTLTLNTSDPEFLTNELRSLVKAEYQNNIKSLYLNSLLESLKFSRLSDLNLNYAINNLELNFKLEYSAAPPVDVIFNNSNNDSYDRIFKKLLKYNIYNQICVKIYQMLKNTRFNYNKNKKKKYANFNDDDLDEESIHNNENINNILNLKLAKLFNKSFKIFKGILSYIYQQIIQKVWNEMEQKIESSMEVFQIIKYHYEALKNITNFFNNNLLIKYFEKLCNDLAQLYLQIMVSDYYDKHQEKTDFLEEVIEKVKDDNKNIINFRDSLEYISPYFPLKSYL